MYRTQYKIDIEKDSGETHHNLPVPAVYIIDKDKKVAFSYVNPDFKVRLESSMILEEIKKIV